MLAPRDPVCRFDAALPYDRLAMTDRAERSTPAGDVIDVHRFFWYWYEWARSPSRRRQAEGLTGLPQSASMILWQLMFHGPLSVTDIGRKMGLQKSTVSRQLQPLRDHGLATEKPGSHNKKVSEVSIAPAGEAVCAQLEDLYIDYWARVVDHMTDAERRRLTTALDGLRRAMEAEAEADPSGFAR